MDPGPLDSKRQRLSWSSSTPQGVTLPHPHHLSTSQLPPPQLPPPSSGPPGLPAPPALSAHHHHHHHHRPPPPPPPSLAPSGPNSYPTHPPRSAPDHSSAPPTPGAIHSPANQHHHQSHDIARRHHEPEAFAPMQEHYRQPQPRPHHQPYQQTHSPVHHAFPPYPPRDSGVKREPHEDPRRPSSTGHASDGVPPSSHSLGASQSSSSNPHPAYSENQPRHMSYDSGPAVTPGPGSYRHPSFPPPTPISQSPYEHHAAYSAPSETFYSVYSSAMAAKKKNTRASQACDQCRQLKAKCDETKPCKTCRDKGTECRYRDPVPKATDKAQADILDGISAMQNSLAALTDHIGRIDHRLNTIESNSSRPGPEMYRKPNGLRDDGFKSAPVTPFAPNGLGHSDRAHVDPPGSTPEHSREHLPSADSISVRLMGEDEIEAEPGPPVPPGEPAIPMNHTTLAGLLLDWPAIRELTKRHLDSQGIRYVSEFPISQEQSRGSLIVYGRGEDSHHSRHARELVDHGTLDMGDDSSDAASPSPAADFGHLGGLSPPDQVEYKGGVLGVDGNPDFTEFRVWEYVEAFKKNVLNLHPIIQPKVLDYWVRHFLDTLPTTHPRSSKPPTSKPAFAVGSTGGTPYSANEMPGSKRKRSPGPDGSDGPPTPGPTKVGKPSRSLHSALILTVLALGKVCLHRDAIPDIVGGAESGPQGSPLARNGVLPSPNLDSPPGFSSHSHSSGLPSPMEHERGIHSRRSSIHGLSGLRPGYSLKKNYEVIPGLEYFAYASDILGNHTGNYNSMKGVYASIFAGLYQGQLGRPLESFAFIHKASHHLQVIMRPSLDKMRKFKRNSEFIQDAKYNQLALAFWTCLQLESDLIAELPLPPSGLLSYEDDMPHPNMSLLQDFDQRELDSYPGQLYLRTHLNSIHRMFYAPEDPNKPGNDKFKNVGLVSDAVSGMNWVAPSFAFKEDDPPADDILSARLRAKYWGAQMITYRPFIKQILQFGHSLKHNPSNPEVPPNSEFRAGIIAPVIQPGAKTARDIDPQVVWLAKKGIKALIESTRAFHGLGDKRPLITNVFGTAHAQWGNLLVLSAAFKDPVLKHHIDEGLLKNLFQRTIQFLRQSAGATSSLRIDMNILEGLQRDLFQAGENRTGSSFSSQTSAQTPTSTMQAPPFPAHSHGHDGMRPTHLHN